MAAALVGGAALGTLFGALYEVVKASMGRITKYQIPLKNLKRTLDSLRPRIIQEIGEQNVELDIPNDDIERLKQQMKEGTKLVESLSKPSMWNCSILCRCCKCWNPSYTNQLTELDKSLKALLEALKLQEARDTKENLLLNRENLLLNRENLLLNRKNLLLNRKMCQKQDELATMESKTLKIAGEIQRAQQEAKGLLSETQKIAGEILRAQQEAKGVQELSGSNTQTVVQEQIGGNGVQQAPSMFYKRRSRRGCLNKPRRRRGCLNASLDNSSPLRLSMDYC